MYTIKQAAARTGVSEASLRAWERRYHVVTPRRSEGGYRLYDEQAIAALTAMRRLVDDGWPPAVAAKAVAGRSADVATPPASEAVVKTATPLLENPEGRVLADGFLAAAAAVDAVGIESVLDRAFALSSFEAVTDEWLMPTLRALGEAWARGDVDVVGEHAGSHAVMRRLSHSFSAAASLPRGPRLVVGLPPGAHHELGALAFATVARRRGAAVVYVGADLPSDSWVRAVRAFPTRAAVLAVPTEQDREAAASTARALRKARPDVAVAVGGAHAAGLDADVVTLPDSITEAARIVEELPV
ncbi:MAG: MerR family transcriptional regulator [Actinomycetota bacterium]